jgi:phage host-nuclease inhibitor protein Gam
MATLGEIESLTKEYADASESLADTIQKLEDAVESLKRQYLPAIKKQVGIAAEKKARLRAAIEDGRELFRRPKTFIIHGWEIGYEKTKEKVSMEDESLTVRLLEEKYPDQKDMYVKTKKSVKKQAVKNLSEIELKLFGIQVRRPVDAVVMRSMESGIKQYVDKLLKEKEEDDAAEEAA